MSYNIRFVQVTVDCLFLRLYALEYLNISSRIILEQSSLHITFMPSNKHSSGALCETLNFIIIHISRSLCLKTRQHPIYCQPNFHIITRMQERTHIYVVPNKLLCVCLLCYTFHHHAAKHITKSQPQFQDMSRKFVVCMSWRKYFICAHCNRDTRNKNVHTYKI